MFGILFFVNCLYYVFIYTVFIMNVFIGLLHFFYY